MKKIMFNDKYGLTEAVLTGRKTMTRRIIPPIEIEWARRGKVTLPVSGFRHGCLWMDCREFLPDSGLFDYVAPQKYQPLYDIGEEVAIAQSYRDIYNTMEEREGNSKANEWWVKAYDYVGDGLGPGVTPGYRNKMFVRADLMPHAIRITGIKVERLQDISDEDALREGIFYYEQPPLHHEMDRFAPWPPYVKPYKHDNDNLKYRATARFAFAYLIDKVNGKGTWQRNPWTWAYEFELIR